MARKKTTQREIERDDGYLDKREYPSKNSYLDGLKSNVDENNVIIRTSFHDFHTNKTLLCRSSVFKTMFSKEWNHDQLFEDGKQLIDFTPLENEIIIGGSMNQASFSEILHYLQTDVVEIQTVPSRIKAEVEEPKKKKKKKDEEDQEEQSSLAFTPYLLQMVALAKYFDLKQMIKEMEDGLDGIRKMMVIHATRTIKEYDLIQLACQLEIGIAESHFMGVPDELLEKVCSQKVFPFSSKLKLISEHAKANYGVKKLSKRILSHYDSILSIMQQELDNSLITKPFKRKKKQPTDIDWDVFGFKFPQFNGSVNKSFAPCAGIIKGNLECDERFAEHHIALHNFEFTIQCGERSSAYWWDFEIHNYHQDVDGFVFMKYYSNWNASEETHGFDWRETTLFAPQLNSSGATFVMFVFMEPK